MSNNLKLILMEITETPSLRVLSVKAKADRELEGYGILCVNVVGIGSKLLNTPTGWLNVSIGKLYINDKYAYVVIDNEYSQKGTIVKLLDMCYEHQVKINHNLEHEIEKCTRNMVIINEFKKGVYNEEICNQG